MAGREVRLLAPDAERGDVHAVRREIGVAAGAGGEVVLPGLVREGNHPCGIPRKVDVGLAVRAVALRAGHDRRLRELPARVHIVEESAVRAESGDALRWSRRWFDEPPPGTICRDEIELGHGIWPDDSPGGESELAAALLV